MEEIAEGVIGSFADSGEGQAKERKVDEKEVINA